MMSQYQGFWSHRGSNDLIFVVTGGTDYVIKQFGAFLTREVTPGQKFVHAGSSDNGIWVSPNWEKLISIEVQTKKWDLGNCKDLHIKFYFDKEDAKASLKKAFREVNYQKNLVGIAEYWDEDKQSHLNEVFSSDSQFAHLNTMVVDSIIKWVEIMSKSSLPVNKNVYIIASEYRDLIREVSSTL